MPRLQIRKGVAAGRDHALGVECVVGRHPSADFVLDDQLISRNHFRVRREGGAWVLEDLESTNGTFVNGQKASRQPLIDGDVIRVGSTELVFVQKDLLTPPKASGAQAPLSRSERKRAGGRKPDTGSTKGQIPPRRKRFGG